MVTFNLICWPGENLSDERKEVELGTFTRPYLPHAGMQFSLDEDIDASVRVVVVEDDLKSGELSVFVVPEVLNIHEQLRIWEILKTRFPIEPKT